jgi:site-specific DNA-methyltransferase (adenine-specific)
MTTPYYADEHVTLYHGDWRDLIDPHLRADLIATDPPYGETSLDWDVWPTGWPTLAARHANAMWCFGSMRMFLNQRDEFTAWRMSQDVVWEKHKGSGFTTDRFKRVHEHAVHWYRGDWSAIRHETPRVISTRRNRGRAVLQREKPAHTGDIASKGWEDDGTRIAPSVMYQPSMHQRAINETEKPTEILEPLIQYGCPPGGLVLDLFAGSASTLVAARNIGRRAIGFEKREDQCEKAARRLAQGTLDFGHPA